MIIFVIIAITLVVIAVTCDFSPLSLTDKETSLIYNDGSFTNEGDALFGNSTVTNQINENDLSADDAKQQAEQLLDQIYNGR